MDVALHLAKRAFALHLLFQGFQRLIDIVVADKNLDDDLVLQERQTPPPGVVQRTEMRSPKELSRRVCGLLSEPELDVHGETGGFGPCKLNL